MSARKYVRALQSRSKVTAVPAGLKREDVVERIAEITEQLKGPLSNTERVLLVHDRGDLRDILALMEDQR